MVTTCCALGCKNRFGKPTGITFHRFPQSETRRRLWAAACGRNSWVENKSCYLCSVHFEENCFDRTGQTVRLRENTIPTIFPALNERRCYQRRFKKLRSKQNKIDEDLKNKITSGRECHFEEQEFEQHRKDGRKKLLQTAVPSVFPTHSVKLPIRQRFNQLYPSESRLNNVHEELQVLQQKVEADQSATNFITDDISSSEENVLETERNYTPETQTQQVPSGNISSISGGNSVCDSTTSLQRCQQEIVLLKQTLHNYKQRAWNMDIVLAALRRENELLRGAVQELSPGHLSFLLEHQSS